MRILIALKIPQWLLRLILSYLMYRKMILPGVPKKISCVFQLFFKRSVTKMTIKGYASASNRFVNEDETGMNFNLVKYSFKVLEAYRQRKIL